MIHPRQEATHQDDSGYVWVCVCTLFGWYVCMYVVTCGVQMSISGVSPHLPPCLRQGLFYFSMAYSR